MKTATLFLRRAALATLIGTPLTTVPAAAQETQGAQPPAEQGQTQQGENQAQGQQAQGGQGQGTQAGQQQGQQADALVATVGDAEIRDSDILMVIGMLPEPLRAQQPEILVPIALEQLVMRELILQEARAQNLAQDPQVRSLAETSAQTAEEDAMVQVWLERELTNQVTDQAVQQAYDNLQATGQQALPPIEQLRPQVEQYLRQQAMLDLRTRLQEGTNVVFYGPGGEPIAQQPSAAQQGQASGGQAPTGNSGGQSQSGSSDGQTGTEQSAPKN